MCRMWKGGLLNPSPSVSVCVCLSDMKGDRELDSLGELMSEMKIYLLL